MEKKSSKEGVVAPSSSSASSSSFRRMPNRSPRIESTPFCNWNCARARPSCARTQPLNRKGINSKAWFVLEHNDTKSGNFVFHNNDRKRRYRVIFKGFVQLSLDFSQLFLNPSPWENHRGYEVKIERFKSLSGVGEIRVHWFSALPLFFYGFFHFYFNFLYVFWVYFYYELSPFC